MEYEEEGIDSDTTGPIMMTGVSIYHNDEPLGLIQALKFTVDVNNPFADLEVTFPDLTGFQISDELSETLEKSRSLFTKILGVKILKRP